MFARIHLFFHLWLLFHSPDVFFPTALCQSWSSPSRSICFTFVGNIFVTG